MAKHRYSEILSDESITTAGTKIIDLNVSDPITALFVQARLTNNGSTPTGHPASALKKIEVVDGSDVLVSLSGAEAQAKHFFDMGKPPVNLLAWVDDTQCVASMLILFGRYLWDEELGLDPGKFMNPQIKIAHDYSLGGSSPDAATLQVYALCFDQSAPALKGFVQSKEIYMYSLTSSAYEYIDLPRDFPLRRLILQSVGTDKAINNQLSEVKLSEDHDKKVPLDETVANIYKMLDMDSKLYIEEIFGATDTSGVDHYVTPTMTVHAALTAMSTAAYLAKEETPGNLFKIVGSAATNFRGLISGHCPHGALEIPFGDLSYPPDAWDVTALKNAQLRVKAGSSVASSSTAQVVVEQYRNY